MNLKSKQRGMSPLVILILCSVFAFVILVTLKLVPHYMDYNTLKSIFQETAKAPEMKTASYRDFEKMVGKRLRINSVYNFKFKENAFLERSDGSAVIGFEYEVKEHMFANIDVLLSFDYETEVKVK